MRTTRWLVLSLIAVAGVFGLTTVAQQQQPAQPVTEIKIVPENPTVNSDIKVELSGTFPNACAPTADAETIIIRQGMRAQVIIYVTNHEPFCPEVLTKWELSVPVGKLPDAGLYQVFVLFNMTKYEDPALLLARKVFDVQAQPAASARGEQAGRQPNLKTALTILMVDQARSDGRWVTFPDVMELAVSDPGAPGPKDSSCTPKKTCRAHGARVTPPSGGSPDTQVELSVGVAEQNTHKLAACIGKQDFEIVKSEQLQRSGTWWGICHGRVKGSNPFLEFQLEQVQLPDLTINLGRLNVRRYTENEQVFCDVTGTATIQNIGKGPAGQLRISRPTGGSVPTGMEMFRRWGLGAGGATSLPVLLTRLRPGNYPIELSVESLSVKETNTANNRAMQVVTCR